MLDRTITVIASHYKLVAGLALLSILTAVVLGMLHEPPLKSESLNISGNPSSEHYLADRYIGDGASRPAADCTAAAGSISGCEPQGELAPADATPVVG